jgi:RNA polymerase sigma-70 factor (ECF subfamily)
VRVVARLQEALSCRGLELFHRLIVEEETVESVCASTGMTADAVYAWKSRIGKVVRRLAAEIASSEPRVAGAAQKDAPAARDVSGSHASPRSPKGTEESR